MSRRPALHVPACLAACILLVSCAPDAADPGVGVVFAARAESGCTRIPADDRHLPEDLDRVVVVARGADGTEVASAAMTAADVKANGAVLLQGVPPGTWRLEVAGCREQAATWWGADPAVTVETSQKSSPVVFLLPAGGLACVGGQNRNSLAPTFKGDDFVVFGNMAFAAVATGPTGRVVAAGGASELSGDEQMTGGRRAWEYLPRSGLFTAIRGVDGTPARLGGARLGHGLAFLDATTVAVFGGATHAALAQDLPGAGGRQPLVPDGAPTPAIEVLSLADGSLVPVAGVTADAWPTVAVDAKVVDGMSVGAARGFAMAGGLDAAGLPTDRATMVVQTTPDAVKAGTVVTGNLARPRFGGTARYLSNGDLLLIGGFDGSGAVPPEVVRVEGATLASSLLGAGYPPAERPATAFPSVAVLADDGATAKVLILGGNPLGKAPSPLWADPQAEKKQAWTLTLKTSEAANGHFDLSAAAQAEVQGVEIPTGASLFGDSWAVRSFATLVPFDPVGAPAPGQWLHAGGYRSFSRVEGVPDCQDNAGQALDVCFPRTLTGFQVTPSLDVLAGWQARDVGRLGAAVTPVGPGAVMILGGLSGIGATTSGSWVESSGVIAFAGGPDLDAICAAHPVLATK